MKTQVIYSYFDEKTGKQLQSSEGVIIEGKVTPARVEAAVIEKWQKNRYNGNSKTIQIEYENIIF
jgi:hypothetical protein